MPKRILVGLDCIMDFRWGALCHLGKQGDVAGEKYRDRLHDRWDVLGYDVANDEVGALLKEGHVRVFQYAIVTNLLPYLAELSTTYEQGPSMEGDARLDITINTYPYQLTNDIKNELSKIIGQYVDISKAVSFVRTHTSGLMPGMLDTQYDAVVMYDYGIWLEDHITDLIANRKPNLTIITPTISFKEIVTEESMKKLDHFSASESTLSAFANWVFVDSNYFSFASKR